VVCSAFFFQPLVWVLARRMEEASDEVADDIVLGAGVSSTSYARDLAAWAERFILTRRESAVALSVIRFRSALRRRVDRILGRVRRVGARLSWKGAFAICSFSAIACLAAALLALRTLPLRRSNVQVTMICGQVRTLALIPGRHGGQWIRISQVPWDSWLLWPYEGGTKLAFEKQGSLVFVEEGGKRRLAGLLIWDKGNIERLCAQLEAGASGFTIWCEGEHLEDLPPLPEGRDLALVCNAEGASDLSPLAEQNAISRLLLFRPRETLDLAPLRRLSVLEYLGLIECKGELDLRPLVWRLGLRRIEITDVKTLTARR
jgi:hypothetical protein